MGVKIFGPVCKERTNDLFACILSTSEIQSGDKK